GLRRGQCSEQVGKGLAGAGAGLEHTDCRLVSLVLPFPAVSLAAGKGAHDLGDHALLSTPRLQLLALEQQGIVGLDKLLEFVGGHQGHYSGRLLALPKRLSTPARPCGSPGWRTSPARRAAVPREPHAGVPRTPRASA